MGGRRWVPRNERGGVALAALGYLGVGGVVVAGFAAAYTQVREGKSPLLPVVLMAGLGSLVGFVAIARRIPRLGAARAPLSAGLAVAVAVGAWFYAERAPVARPDEAIFTAMATACRGDPVPAAGAYLPQGGPPFHVVLLTTEGEPHQWSGKPAMDWKPASVADTELVACLEARSRQEVLEVCPYQGGSDITRYRKLMHLDLVAPRGGETVWSTTLRGDPRECQFTENEDVEELVGTLTFDDVERALAPYLDAEVLPAHEVPVQVLVKGQGRVRQTDGPLRCRGPRTCDAKLAAGIPVTLRARPAPGWRFAGWDGPCSGAGLCTFEPAGGDRVVAVFVRR